MGALGLLVGMDQVACALMFFAFVALTVNGSTWSNAMERGRCLWGECCDNAIHFDPKYYYGNLTEKLYGQHIAIERMYYHVKAHLDDPSPRRSLVFSLNGFTGVGKNYAISILASSLYRKGQASRFYHFFDSTIDFLFDDSIENYKADLFNEIRDGVRACERSMFVFDEVHKMPSGVLDSLVPILGFTEFVGGLNYRKAIFVFIGNNGASKINEHVLKILNSGKHRASIQYGDLRPILSMSIYNEKGVFQHSNLISQHALTAMVPFLPLQEVHVRACVNDSARRLGIEFTEAMADFVLNELDWEPEGTRLFSTSGCKLVYDKVGFYILQQGIKSDAYPAHGEL